MKTSFKLEDNVLPRREIEKWRSIAGSFEGIQDHPAKSTAGTVSGSKWIVVCRIGSADNSQKLSYHVQPFSGKLLAVPL